jgi:lauroyl/myristoyl acyltransferase
MALRSVGLLAQHYQAAVAVAGIRRIARAFRFEILVSAILQPEDWALAADPLAFITGHYVAALERIVLQDPTQYLWSHARWGEEAAPQLTEAGDAVRPDRLNAGDSDRGGAGPHAPTSAGV